MAGIGIGLTDLVAGMSKPTIPPEKPSLHSRFNKISKFVLASAADYGPSLLPIHPDAQIAVAIIGTSVVLAGWDRFYAAVFVNRNHQPQSLYTLPWDDGVLVVQPRHHLAVNPYRPWRLRMRDERLDSLYMVHGYFSTQALADQYCQNVSKVGVGHALNPDADKDTGFRQLIVESEAQAGRQFKQILPDKKVPQSAWVISTIPDDATRYCAFRSVLTTTGPRVEFVPPPPGGLLDTLAVKRMLKPQLDPHLDKRQLDQSMDGLPEALRQTWRAQAAPWSLIEVGPDRWTSVQLDAAGQAIGRKPAPPDTVSVDTLLARLRPLLAPSAPDPAVTDDAQQVALWRAAAWQARPNPLKPLGHMPWDHPLAQAAGLSADSHEAVWCVSPHPHQPERFLAVRLQPSPTGVALAGLMDPLHPERLWVDNPPVLADTLRQIWPDATIRQDIQIPLGSAAAVTPDVTVATPSLSRSL